jgi:hypothetical protein
MQAHMARVGSLLGVDLRPATAKEHELTYLRRMAWLRSLEGHGTKGQKEPTGSTQQKIDHWIEQFKKSPTKKSDHYGAGMVGTSKLTSQAANYNMGGVGYDPRYDPERDANGKPKLKAGKVVMKKDAKGNPVPNPDYKPVAEDIGGRLANWRFDVSEKEIAKAESEGRVLTHGAWGGADGVNTMVRSGVMIANEQRQLRGIGNMGQSPGTDRKVGGSYETYWNTSSQPSSSSGTISVSVRLLGYTASTTNPYHDPYGNKKPGTPLSSSSSVLNRAATLDERRAQLLEILARIGSGETTIGSKVDLRKWLVRATPAGGWGTSGKASKEKNREAMIKSLKGHGVTEIRGKKVEDVIT